MKKYGKMIYLGVFLALVSFIAAGVMGLAASVTEKAREKAARDKMTDGLRQVLPEFDNDLLATKKVYTASGNLPAEVYAARKGGKLVGIAIKTSSMKGYAGKIEGIISFSPAGEVYTLVITSHQETPGLGAAIAERKETRTLKSLFTGNVKKKSPFPSHLPANPVLDQFRGKKYSGKSWKLKNEGGEIDSVSGATVTSHAVTDLASRAAEVFFKNQKVILAHPAKEKKGAGK